MIENGWCTAAFVGMGRSDFSTILLDQSDQVVRVECAQLIANGIQGVWGAACLGSNCGGMRVLAVVRWVCAGLICVVRFWMLARTFLVGGAVKAGGLVCMERGPSVATGVLG